MERMERMESKAFPADDDVVVEEARRGAVDCCFKLVWWCFGVATKAVVEMIGAARSRATAVVEGRMCCTMVLFRMCRRRRRARWKK